MLRVFRDELAVLRTELEQGAVAEGIAEEGARATVWAAFVIIWCFFFGGGGSRL